jgi:hypothetical protein
MPFEMESRFFKWEGWPKKDHRAVVMTTPTHARTVRTGDDNESAVLVRVESNENGVSTPGYGISMPGYGILMPGYGTGRAIDVRQQ